MGHAIRGSHTFFGDSASLDDFDDRWVAAVDIQKYGHWVIMGCVTVTNLDGDAQHASARLSSRFAHDVLFEVDPASRLPGDDSICFYLQATYENPEGSYEQILLSCSTYRGVAKGVSLIALEVDYIEYQ